MTDQPPTSNAAKAITGGVGAVVVIAAALLVGRHQATTPAPVRPITAAASAPSVYVPPAGAAGGVGAGNPDALNTPAGGWPAPPVVTPPAATTITDDDIATANRYALEPGYEYLAGRGDLIHRWRAQDSSMDPVVWLAQAGYDSWLVDCDVTTSVSVSQANADFRNEWSGAEWGVDAMYNPHAHGVDWNKDPETVRQWVKLSDHGTVSPGPIEITLKAFPCVHSPYLEFAVKSAAQTIRICPPACPGQCDATGKCVAFNPGVLHPVSAAALYAPASAPAPAATLPPGAVALKCGMTGRDDFGRTTFPSRCSAAEILLGPGAYRTPDGVAHAAGKAQVQ